MKYMKPINWIFLLLIFLSCQNSQKEQVRTILQEWEGRTIQYPEKMVFTIRGNDTVDFSLAGKYKILSYVDSTGCTSCKLGLKEWSEYISQMDSLTAGQIKFLFFFFPKDGTEIYQTLRINRFAYPICIDNTDALNELNKFPSDERFQTFLLNESDSVLAIGNPIHNPKIKELYLKIIQDETVTPETETPQTLTTFSIDRTSVQMGRFDWQQEQTAPFTLTNTGDKPLVIQAVDTSCGCVTVSYSEEPVRPGGSTTLRVTYKAEHPESFGKTVTVHCNAEDSPLRLTVRGEAV